MSDGSDLKRNSIRITDCTISGNRGGGAVIEGDVGNVEVERVDIFDNRGDGILIKDKVERPSELKKEKASIYKLLKSILAGTLSGIATNIICSGK